MSWQATAWAAKQQTGSAARKLTLLALANYADPNGVCWPTQETLANDTEQSIDTVQRQVKQLVSMGLLRVEKRPAQRGQWSGRVYFLNLSVTEMSEPQSAVRPEPCPSSDHAAPAPVTMPHQARPPCRTAMRHKPPIKHPNEPSAPQRQTRSDNAPSGTACCKTPRSTSRAATEPLPQSIEAALRKKLGNDVFASWFTDAALIRNVGGEITISTSTKFKASRINIDYADVLLHCWQAIDPDVLRVTAITHSAAASS